MKQVLLLATSIMLLADAQSGNGRLQARDPKDLIVVDTMARRTPAPQIGNDADITPFTNPNTGAGSTGGTNSNSSNKKPTESSNMSANGVKCRFRYSLPTGTNLKEGTLTQGNKTKSSADGSLSGSSNGNGSSHNSTSSSSGSGHKDSSSSSSGGSSTRPPSTDSGSGASGSTNFTTKTPSPSPKSSSSQPTPTPLTPGNRPTTPTFRPPVFDGSFSNGGNTRRAGRMLADETEETVGNLPRPSPNNNNLTPMPLEPTTGGGGNPLVPSPSTLTPTPSVSTPSAGSGSGIQMPANDGEFSCDASFYGAWIKMGLKCGEQDLDVTQAVSSAQCLVYSGAQSDAVVSDMKMCMSVCRFPKCADGVWDYTASDGLNSAVYRNLNFVQLMQFAGAGGALGSQTSSPFSNLTLSQNKQCAFEGDKSFSDCKCEIPSIMYPGAGSRNGLVPAPIDYTVPTNKGLGDFNHWPDGRPKKSIDKAGIASATIGGSAAAVSVAAGGIMTVAGGFMGTTGGVATGVSAGASAALAMATVDLCQFGLMINQMNLEARPRFLEDMGRRMAPAGFSFLPFGKAEATGRRLEAETKTETQGMERYARLIGVRQDQLFYLTLAGVAVLIGALFVLYGLAMLLCCAFVSDFGAFARKWLDKTIGVLMMILILSEYVIGVTATFQFCWCISNNKVDASLVLAICTLLFCALGTILFGIVVIKNHEDELRDLGTKDHFEKPVHARYGPLYDEYRFEGRFFFAPKLMLALLCGMTTGMIWLRGVYQIIILIVLHIVFLFYLELKQPYPTQFVQKASSFVIIIKISALFLTFFLISSTMTFFKDIPTELRDAVGFAIIGLQVLVLIALMIRQVYIFYRTWKLKRDKSNQKSNGQPENFFALGDNIHHNNGGSLPILGGDQTPSSHFMQQTPVQPPLRHNRFTLRQEAGAEHRGMQQPLRPQQRLHSGNGEVDL